MYQLMTKHIDVSQGKKKSMGDAPGAASGGCTVARMSTRKTPAKEGESPPATSNGATKTLFSCENSNIVDLARDPVAPVTCKVNSESQQCSLS